MKRLFISILLSIFYFSVNAEYVKGKVTDQGGNALLFASVYVKNSVYGVATDTKGEYFLELKTGNYILVFSYLGFETVEKSIKITNNKPIILNVILQQSAEIIGEVEIFSNKKDPAKRIMANVRANRKIFLDAVENYRCKTYLKTSLEKESLLKTKSDSLRKDTVPSKGLDEHLKKEKLNLLESISISHFKNPSSYMEKILAHHDYAEVKKEVGKSVSLSIDVGEENIIPETTFEDNPYIIVKDLSTGDINFYKNLINIPSLAQKPFLSPLAANSAISYSFLYDCAFFEKGKKIHKIEVIPRNNAEPLFRGFIYIQDSSWALVTADLTAKGPSLQFCKDFRIIQNYQHYDSNIFVPERREFFYTIREGKSLIMGNTRMDHSNYEVNIEMPENTFKKGSKTFDVYAFDKDSSFWANERPLVLKDNELNFIHKTDSLRDYYSSDEFYAKLDSAFNRIDWWFWLAGVGRRNRSKGTEWYVSGLPEQVNPFGVGGYRHKLPGYFNKEFKNNWLLENKGFIDYGFRNEDVKGKISVGLTYFPLKFVRTRIIAGSFYEMINQYASIEQTFARSNYVHSKTFGLAQRMELINGLYAELSFEFSDQNPINNLELDNWSESLFGELNTPADFERYKKSELKLEIKYRLKQDYIIKGNKKYIIGTDFPEFQLVYRKGIPQVFESEVDFDFIEIGAKDEMQLARFGSSGWELYAGTFFNKNNLRVLENKYFRGSDRFFFSDPRRSFQLLGPSLNTNAEYFRANYIHHFEGAILNKIPLLKKMKLGLAGGAGTLIMSDNSFSHFEMFGGFEKIFRIKKQLFRFGIYAVTSDNNLSEADFTIKFGINFFNTFTNKWDY
ncbi:MAG: carboxypeptidase-like regulatory domain-containing protein [Bacteroidales bacterium]|nr:carboxypeptidase-like regulatory domain-containing protein [Bacteroidales bacterium]